LFPVHAWLNKGDILTPQVCSSFTQCAMAHILLQSLLVAITSSALRFQLDKNGITPFVVLIYVVYAKNH